MNYKSEKSFTLIEILIVVAILALIIIATYNLLLIANKATLVSQNQGEINQKTRFYFDSIAKKIRSSAEEPLIDNNQGQIILQIDGSNLDGSADEYYKYELKTDHNNQLYIAYYSSNSPSVWGVEEKRYLTGIIQDVEYEKLESKIRIKLTLSAGGSRDQVNNTIVDETYMKMID